MLCIGGFSLKTHIRAQKTRALLQKVEKNDAFFAQSSCNLKEDML